MNWNLVASMEESRTCIGAAMFDSACLIIAGGFGNYGTEAFVVLYDMHIDK